MATEEWTCLACGWQGSDAKEKRAGDITYVCCPNCDTFLSAVENIKEDFRDTVKGIRVYAKNNKRFKNRPKPTMKNSRCRSLSDEQIAGVEKKMLDNGDKINPVHMEGMKMSAKEDKKARLGRLAKSMTELIKEEGFFNSSMIRKSESYRMYIAPNSTKYFERTFLDDIKALGEAGLFYSKGHNPKSWYVGSRPAGKEDSSGMGPLASSLMPDKKGERPSGLYVSNPVHIVVDINININLNYK